MKSGRSSLDLTGSPYLPAKTKSSQTPLKAKNTSASRHSISIPKTAIYSSSKRQSTHSPVRSNLHHDERVNKTPIKNQSVKNVPRTHENVRVVKDSHTYKNTLSSLNKGMIKGGIEDKEIKKNNYIYVSDELKAPTLVQSPDSKDLQSDNKKTDKLPQNPDGKTDTDKTKIILFDDQQIPQQEQNDEVNQRADASKLVQSKTQIIGTEKIKEKVVKKFGFCKEGYLMKRPLLPFGWERIYFLAGDLKLYYAPSQELFETKTNVKCLNLLSNICEVIVHDEKGQEFSIAARGLGSVLSLKANSVEEANEWILFLKTLFIFAHQTVVESNKKYIPSQEVFHKSDVILEEEFLATLDTGDILLLHGGHFAAKMQRIFTVSEYDHLALIMRNKDEIFLFDSTTEYGVQLMSWKDFKQDKHYLGYPTLAYRKLNIKDENLKDEVKQKLWEFVTLQVGKKYELGFKKLFRKPSFDENENEHNRTSDLNTTLEVGISHEHKDMKNVRSVNAIKTPSLTSLYRDSDEGFFCSELVAAGYKFAGLLDATISSTRYLPVSFSQRRELVMLMGCTLSNEHALALLNEHEPIVPKCETNQTLSKNSLL